MRDVVFPLQRSVHTWICTTTTTTTTGYWAKQQDYGPITHKLVWQVEFHMQTSQREQMNFYVLYDDVKSQPTLSEFCEKCSMRQLCDLSFLIMGT